MAQDENDLSRFSSPFPTTPYHDKSLRRRLAATAAVHSALNVATTAFPEERSSMVGEVPGKEEDEGQMGGM